MRLSPWSGMSGNFAMQDSADLATALLELQRKEQGGAPSHWLAPCGSARESLSAEGR